MTKVEMEKPVVSKELAEEFEKEAHNQDKPIKDMVNPYTYSLNLPERKWAEDSEFTEILIDMYALGYEIEKPKLKYIVLNDATLDPEYVYLNSCESKHSLQLHTKNWKPNFKTQFTDEEAEKFLENAQKGMWRLEEVEQGE